MLLKIKLIYTEHTYRKTRKTCILMPMYTLVLISTWKYFLTCFVIQFWFLYLTLPIWTLAAFLTRKITHLCWYSVSIYVLLYFLLLLCSKIITAYILVIKYYFECKKCDRFYACLYRKLIEHNREMKQLFNLIKPVACIVLQHVLILVDSEIIRIVNYN